MAVKTDPQTTYHRGNLIISKQDYDRLKDIERAAYAMDEAWSLFMEEDDQDIAEEAIGELRRTLGTLVLALV